MLRISNCKGNSSNWGGHICCYQCTRPAKTAPRKKFFPFLCGARTPQWGQSCPKPSPRSTSSGTGGLLWSLEQEHSPGKKYWNNINFICYWCFKSLFSMQLEFIDTFNYFAQHQDALETLCLPSPPPQVTGSGLI